MNKTGTNANKDVIYIDVDDEITGIIDKLRSSNQKIVALVLPKRATVLQSVVNMKLLKRTADQTKKNVVLITSEAGLLPLAGSVGLHVAKALNVKPEIPDTPGAKDDDQTETITDDAEETEAAVDKTKTVGELAGATAVNDELEDSITLDDEDESPISGGESGKTKGKKDKKFKIPNFSKFRLLFILGGAGVVALIVFLFLAISVLPKAKVIVKTDSLAVNGSSVVTLKTGTGVVLDAEKAIIPAESQELKKTATQEVPATGQQNNGTKATGKVDMTAKNCSSLASPTAVPAGTGITTGGRTYITQEKATFGNGTFDGTCLNFNAKNISITAQTGGTSFNVDSATFTVAGRSDVTAAGSTSGGTDDIIKIVTQADIDSAKQKIAQQDTVVIQQELTSGLIGRSLYAVEATFSVGAPEVKSSLAANTPGETVTVTQDITYSMLGAKKEDLEAMIKKSVADKIDSQKQSILEYGLDKAVVGLQTKNPDGVSITLQATVLAGAELNLAEIKKQIAGKKANNAKELIKANPGVTDVTVTYSPFWVSSIPKNVNKITLTVEEPQVTTTKDEPNN